MKNEGPFLLEWISFHRAIGFDQFLIFTNDCEDGSDDLADLLASKGMITHVRNNDYQKRGPQWTALNSPSLRKALKGVDWALHLDLDEFLNIKVGDGQISDLHEKIGDPDAISIPWRFFGNAGVTDFQDVPILEQFTKCAPYPIMFPRQAMMFKTLFRPSDALDRGGVHAPRLSKDANLSDLTWLNGDGRRVSETFNPKNPILYRKNFGNNLAQINHYALRSMESFLVKSERGLPNMGHVPVDVSYWVRRNFNNLEDKSLADGNFQNDLNDDPDLLQAHQKCCKWHGDKILELLGTAHGIDLYSAIATAGDSIVPDPSHTKKLYYHLGRVFGGGRSKS